MHYVEKPQVVRVYCDSSLFPRFASHRFSSSLISVYVAGNDAIVSIFVSCIESAQHQSFRIADQYQMSFQDCLELGH